MIKNILITTVYDQEYIKVYLDLISEIKPDIIHIHGTENPFACIIGKTDIPIVVSIQGLATVISHKYCSGLNSSYLKTTSINFRQGLKSIILARSFGAEYKRMMKIADIESRNITKVQFLIGRTQWDKRTTSVLAPEAQYYQCDEILRDGFYKKVWTTQENTSLIIHSTSANIYFKGFETLCRSLNELNKMGIKTEWRVAGIRETDLIVKLTKEHLGKNFPITGLVLLGHLGENDLITKMLEADIFVMASHIENSSNNLCEAMILGMPCIATFAGGTGSLVKDSEEGILIQDGDPWAMAGAILELAKNSEKSCRLGSNARAAALKRHNKTQIVNDLLDIYNKVLGDESV